MRLLLDTHVFPGSFGLEMHIVAYSTENASG